MPFGKACVGYGLVSGFYNRKDHVLYLRVRIVLDRYQNYTPMFTSDNSLQTFFFIMLDTHICIYQTLHSGKMRQFLSGI